MYLKTFLSIIYFLFSRDSKFELSRFVFIMIHYYQCVGMFKTHCCTILLQIAKGWLLSLLRCTMVYRPKIPSKRVIPKCNEL